MGNGVVRPATSYRTYDGSARAGLDLANAWRVDGRVSMYRGKDINTPGDVFAGLTSQGRKDLERTAADLRVSGPLARHLLSGTFYTADEQNHTLNVTTTNPLDLPYLPYLTFENALGWSGVQVKDAWSWSSASSLLIGLDVERASSESRSYARTGRPAGAVLREQPEEHRRPLRGKHLASVGGADGPLGGWTDRPDCRRDSGDAVQDQLHAVDDDVYRVQSERRGQAAGYRRRSPACDGRTRVRAGRRQRADRLHHEHRRRTNADQPGQSRPQAGAQHQRRRRRRSPGDLVAG